MTSPDDLRERVARTIRDHITVHPPCAAAGFVGATDAILALITEDRARLEGERDAERAIAEERWTMLRNSAADTVKAEAERDAAREECERLRSFVTEGSWEALESEMAWKRRALAAEAEASALRARVAELEGALDRLERIVGDVATDARACEQALPLDPARAFARISNKAYCALSSHARARALTEGAGR